MTGLRGFSPMPSQPLPGYDIVDNDPDVDIARAALFAKNRGNYNLAMTPSHHRIAVILGSLVALGPLSIDMYLPAFPELARDLRTDRGLGAAHACRRISSASPSARPSMGRWPTGYGRRAPAAMPGWSYSALASVACALATSIDILIALRFVQALGGCAGMVITPRGRARLVRRARVAARRSRSLMLVIGLAPILAPVIGGWLVVHQGWRAIFWALAGFGALNLLSVRLTLGESLPASRRQRHDLMTRVQDLWRAAARPPFHALRPGRRADHRRDVRLHRRLALRLHGDPRGLARGLWIDLRRECGGIRSSRPRSTAGW